MLTTGLTSVSIGKLIASGILLLGTLSDRVSFDVALDLAQRDALGGRIRKQHFELPCVNAGWQQLPPQRRVPLLDHALAVLCAINIATRKLAHDSSAAPLSSLTNARGDRTRCHARASSLHIEHNHRPRRTAELRKDMRHARPIRVEGIMQDAHRVPDADT